jgi:hypothetical protein
MAELAAIELHHVALPTRREHEWSGLTEAIGGYVLVEMTDAAGTEGWGEAPVLMDWGGEFGGYFGESPGTTTTLQPMIVACVNGRSSRTLISCSAGQTTNSENVPIRAIWLTGSPLSLTRVVPSCITQCGVSLWPTHRTVRPDEQ